MRYCAQKVGAHVLKLLFYGYLLAGIYKPLSIQLNACALHKLIHKSYHVRLAFFRAENYGYNAAYVLAEGDGITAVYGTGAYGGALAAYALGIGGLRYGGGIKAVYYNPLRRGGYAADGAGRFKKNYGAAANAVHKAKHKIEYFIRAVRGKQQRVKLIKPCGALRA